MPSAGEERPVRPRARARLLGGDAASDAAPVLGTVKQAGKAVGQGSAFLEASGRKMKESSTGRAERQDARDHATYLNSERGSRDINAMQTAIAQQIEAKGVKGTNSLRSDPSPELQNLMDKDLSLIHI